MRYCIGCAKLQYEDKKMGCGSTWTGSWTREEASMSCALGHWKAFLEDYGTQWAFDLERAMENAATCPDFVERPDPKSGDVDGK